MTTQRKVAFVASNKATSSVTGWPIGFWLSELTHPWQEFAEVAFEIELFSPEGGPLYMDDWSDPRADNGYSADDEISKEFLADPERATRLEDTRPLSELDVAAFDVVFLVGGQGPMETFRGNPEVEAVVRDSLAAGQPTAVVCHATSVLLDAEQDGRLLVDGRRWTGFSTAEEQYVENVVGQRFQPFWIEEEAAKLQGTTFVAGEPMTSHVVVDGDLITGQQQNSGAEAARAAIAALA